MVRPVRSRLSSSLVLAAVFLLPGSSIATAETFASTFNFGKINLTDFSTPPQFFTGPFNYGFSPLGLNSAVSGVVHVTDISFSADAAVNFPLVLQNGDLAAFNWEIYVGPLPFGFVPGQVTGSFTEPQTLSGTAPTLLQFSQSDSCTTAPHHGIQRQLRFHNYQAFLWTEADDNIDLNDTKVTASGTAVPETFKPSYAWKQLVERHHVC